MRLSHFLPCELNVLDMPYFCFRLISLKTYYYPAAFRIDFELLIHSSGRIRFP
jgi:hypothetical protein